ncbi:prolyl oligopeptidase family serine peptidase [Kitasatospora sp. NA04385]|uniref:alpha/beta hydrolase family protein n=1 Tax=Kitasatospora sp. NA04385 TaxID=2742135 RepID=UPI001592A1DC|nr:prolyl oligopeptidase family serine peptidase [Kitasatospora sp. NA04385]QKW20571.1 prolyl oligopeptidase family serine peptidase [Kitasatospora sp. NA04385]
MTEHGGLSAGWVARTTVALDELQVSDGRLWWLQSDPEHGGVRRVARAEPSGAARFVTPADRPVGGGLHAYGGGAFAVTGSTVWFTGRDGSLLRRTHQGGAEVVAAAGEHQYGDLAADGEGLLAVRGGDGEDEIVSVAADGRIEVLVRSTGFLGSPRSASGRLCFTEWDRDRMPWDSCRVLTSALGDPGSAETVAGGSGESAVQPGWGPEGRLYFFSDRTGWWNLYRRLERGGIESVAPMEADCAPAPWEGGYRSYAFTGRGGIVLTASDGITTELLLVDGAGRQRRIGTNLSSVKPYCAVLGDAVAVIASTPVSAPSLWLVALEGNSTAEAHPNLEVAADNDTPPTVRPQVLAAPGPGGDVRFVLHRPATPGRVPLLLRVHPGPTDDVRLRLDRTTQFWVSRGFAVAEPLYRGSTGRGRAFRSQLYGRWGEFDVEDCAAVAEYLVGQGVADADAVFISGASAGGYTALNAACRTEPFAAATAISAIIDPGRWARSVPAWQRPHAVALRGPAGAVRPERVRRPVLVVHGSMDDITSATDAMAFADALGERGMGRGLLLEGGDHYLSNPRDLEAALEAELAFYRDVMSYPAGGRCSGVPRG